MLVLYASRYLASPPALYLAPLGLLPMCFPEGLPLSSLE